MVAMSSYGAATQQLDAAQASSSAAAVGGIAMAGYTLAMTAMSLGAQHSIAKSQARVAKAQAQLQASQYAAEAVGYEVAAERLKDAFAAQEYETIRQQNAYLEDMTVDAAVRGGAMEGSNTYMIAEQAREFERGNAYARLQNAREQANYITAAQQSYANAENVIATGNANATAIKSSARVNLATGLVSAVGSFAGSALQTYNTYSMNTHAISAARTNIQATNQYNTAAFGSVQAPSSGTVNLIQYGM